MLYTDAKKLFSDALAGKIRLKFGNPIHVEAVRTLSGDLVNWDDIKCSHCDGKGNLECHRCDGTGRVECKNCDGEGYTEGTD